MTAQGHIMNVLHLRSSGGFAGAEKVILSLSDELQHLGLGNSIACIDNHKNSHTELTERSKEIGLASINISSTSRFDVKVIKAVSEILKERNIDILHTHGYKEDILGYFSAKRNGVARIATVHGWTGHDMKVRCYELLDKYILRFFDKVIAVSYATKKKLINAGIPENKIAVIHNGIDLTQFHVDNCDISRVKKELKIGDEDKVIGTVGRLSKEKGHRYLLEAASLILKEHPKAKFVIVGDGAERRVLAELTDMLHIKDRVIFTGHKDNVSQYYAIFDIFVLPSITEGLPLGLLEAMAMKKAVIASNVGGIPEVIEDNKTGILLPPKKPVLLAKAILELLQHKERAASLAEKGRALIEKEFSVKVMAEKYKKIYEEVLAN